VLAGYFIYRVTRVPDILVRDLSLLVFRVGLPVVLFFGAVQVDYTRLGTAKYVLAGSLASLAVVACALIYANARGWRGEQRAIFTQGAYRANLGIIGIALCAEAYGQEGLALAALPVAVMTILYNLVAVVLLNHAYGKGYRPAALLGGIISNPLVVGIAAGIICSLAGVELGPRMERAGALFSLVWLPLALMCIGASLNLGVLRRSSQFTLEATFWKLVLMPVIAVLVGGSMGIHGAEMGVLFLLLSAPVAAASYIMVMAAGGNGALSANIVVVSTIFSILTLTVGLAALQWWGLV
jgi:predicted permease